MLSKILAYLSHLFSDEPDRDLSIIDAFEPSNDVDSRPFWEGLPSLGSDQEVRIATIKRAHPIHDTNPDPYIIRRKVYQSILSLRTETKHGWVNDRYKKDKVNFA